MQDIGCSSRGVCKSRGCGSSVAGLSALCRRRYSRQWPPGVFSNLFPFRFRVNPRLCTPVGRYSLAGLPTSSAQHCCGSCSSRPCASLSLCISSHEAEGNLQCAHGAAAVKGPSNNVALARESIATSENVCAALLFYQIVPALLPCITLNPIPHT